MKNILMFMALVLSALVLSIPLLRMMDGLRAGKRVADASRYALIGK